MTTHPTQYSSDVSGGHQASDKSAQEMRQGETKLGVRYVLGISLALAIAVLAIVVGVIA